MLRLFTRKLNSRWSGPFIVTQVFPYGTIEITHPNKGTFKAKGQRVKPYFGSEVKSDKVSILLDKAKSKGRASMLVGVELMEMQESRVVDVNQSAT